MNKPFQRTSFIADESEVFISRHYITGSRNVIPLTWDEAAELHKWLSSELGKRSDGQRLEAK